MAEERIHVGDVGTRFLATIKDESGAIVSLAGGTVTMKFKKPNGEVLTRAGTLVGDGSTGQAEYFSVAGDLSLNGSWVWRCYAEVPAGKWHTDPEHFTVEPVF